MAAFKETKFPADAPVADKALGWVDDRFPLSKLWNDQWGKYYAPKNFNFWYIFGSLAMLVLVLQIVTGIFLTMHYKPDANLAFGSVEYHARSAVGLAGALYALDRRLRLLHHRVPAHDARPAVRFLPQAT
jgi:hypothetical protein